MQQTRSLMPLRQLADDLWVMERPQKFYGLEVGTRMSVIRLRSGRLWLHSPVPLTSELREELDALGEVSFAVAPNRLHHLYAGGVQQSYPKARLWGAPGLELKRPDLTFEGILGDEAPQEWRGEIDQIFSQGRPMENEVVFFHQASRTLVVSDFAFNIGPNSAPVTRVLMKLSGSYGILAPSLLERLAVRSKPLALASLERILEWDFDRVIMAHGDVVLSGGKERLREGYQFLLRARVKPPLLPRN